METIKYEVPDGYECSQVDKEVKEDYIILKHTLTKINKNFDWYIKKYSNYIENKHAGVLSSSTGEWFFEYRIGLLKFICDDLNVSRKDKYSYVFILNQYEYGTTKDCEFMKVFDSICPKEFVDSLV